MSVGTPVMFQKVYGAVVELAPAWFGTAQVNGPEPGTLTTSGFMAEGAVRYVMLPMRSRLVTSRLRTFVWPGVRVT